MESLFYRDLAVKGKSSSLPSKISYTRQSKTLLKSMNNTPHMLPDPDYVSLFQSLQ